MPYTISIIIPAYNEENSIPELYRQIMASIHGMQKNNLICNYEVLFVNDGSTDQTEEDMNRIPMSM